MRFLFAIHASVCLLSFLTIYAGPKEGNLQVGWVDPFVYLYHTFYSGKNKQLKEVCEKRDHAKFAELLNSRDIALYPEILEEALYNNWFQGLEIIFKHTTNPADLVKDLVERHKKNNRPLNPLVPTLIRNFGCAALPTVELLISNGFPLNECDAQNHTALHIACMNGDTKVLNLLIDSGADLLAQDANGNTALHIATLHKQAHIIPLLLAKAPELMTVKNNVGNQAMHLLIEVKNGAQEQPPITLLDETDRAMWASFGEHIDIYATNAQGISPQSCLQSQTYWCTPTRQMIEGAHLTSQEEVERTNQCKEHIWHAALIRRASNTQMLKQQLAAKKAEAESEFAQLFRDLYEEHEKLAQTHKQIAAQLSELETAREKNQKAQEENRTQLDQQTTAKEQKLERIEQTYMTKIAAL